ncbi:MAG: hypothetical protein R2746_08255 [Acidimicrobiales bacterium]|nr:hypothetical protein [Actinomycetota bacterium]
MSETTQPDPATVITRNVLIGWIATFVVTVALVVAAGQSVAVAAGVAATPALFAGPFVAGMLTVAHYHRIEDHDQDS